MKGSVSTHKKSVSKYGRIARLWFFSPVGKIGTTRRLAGHMGRAGGTLEEVHPARGAAAATPLDRYEAWKMTNFLYM